MCYSSFVNILFTCLFAVEPTLMEFRSVSEDGCHWTVPQSEEGEGWGRNVPHWQSMRGCGGALWTAWTPSLSLPQVKITTVANLKGLTRTKATGAKNSEALVAQSCLLLLCQYIKPESFYIFCQVYPLGWIIKNDAGFVKWPLARIIIYLWFILSTKSLFQLDILPVCHSLSNKWSKQKTQHKLTEMLHLSVISTAPHVMNFGYNCSMLCCICFYWAGGVLKTWSTLGVPLHICTGSERNDKTGIRKAKCEYCWCRQEE